jgi:hypothetical protein
VVKLYASHRFDFFGGDLNVGFNWTYQSGSPTSVWDDGSTSNGYAPGYDTAHQYYDAAGHPVVANSDVEWNKATNWSGGAVGSGDFNGTGGSHQFLDIGFYGDAVAANGRQGDAGRTPALNNVDLHLDWAYKFGKKYKLIPSVDVFNLFNTRYATDQLQQATDQGGGQDVRFGYATAWQVGRRYRFGVKFQF